MPTAPTINTVQQKGQYVRVQFTDSGSGDHNYLERMCPQEYGGQFIKIADPLPWSTSIAQFRDYGVAGGRIYTYRLTAVDSSGGTATSATVSQDAVIGISGAIIHAHQKVFQFSPTLAANAENLTAVALHDYAPYQLTRSVKTTTRQVANSTTPNVSSGRVQSQQIAIPAWSGYGANDYRAALRAIYRSDFYACLRTPGSNGMKIFGVLVPPSEKYGGATADVSFVFSQRSMGPIPESVA